MKGVERDGLGEGVLSEAIQMWHTKCVLGHMTGEGVIKKTFLVGAILGAHAYLWAFVHA